MLLSSRTTERGTVTDVTDPRAGEQGRTLRELFVVHQALSTRLSRALRPLGLSMSHVSFLTHLATIGGRSSFSDLAAALEVNQPAVSKNMQALKALGAVEVSSGSVDARRRDITLTPAGYALLSEAHRAMHPEATVAFAGMDDARLGAFRDDLESLREHLDAARVLQNGD